MEKFKELSFEEMQEVDGGLPWVAYGIYVGLILLADIALNPSSSIESFTRWFEDGKK